MNIAPKEAALLSQTDRKCDELAMGSGIARESLSDRKLSQLQLQLQLQLQQLTTSMAGFSPNRSVSDARRANAVATASAGLATSDDLVTADATIEHLERL